MAYRKPYAEHTVDERVASLRKIQGVLAHSDWRELYLRWSADAQAFQEIMDGARSWDEYLDARGAKVYIKTCLLDLRERVNSEKEVLETDLLTEKVPLPTEYETE